MRLPSIASMFGSRFFRDNLIVLVINNLTNVFMYLGQMVLSRSLSRDDFGIFNSVLNLTLIVFSFLNVISFSTAKTLANLTTVEERRGFSRRTLKYVVQFAFLSSFGFFIASGEISDFLNLPSRMPIYISIVVTFVLVIQSLFAGLVQGEGKYLQFSIGMFLQSVMRFFGFILVLLLGLTYNIALGAVLLSVTATLVYYVFSVRGLLQGAFKPVEKGIFRAMSLNMLNILFMSVLVALITNTDLILVRHFFSGEEAGFFTVAALIGRISYYMPGLLIFILFAEVARNDAAQKSPLQSLLITGGLTTILLGVYVIFVSLFPEFVITLLFGEHYVEARDLTILISVTMAIFSLTNILFNFFTARGVVLYLYPSYGLFVATVAMVFGFYHDTPMQIALILLIGMSTIFIVNVILAGVLYRKDIRKLFASRES
mgnify:CR=1 FL=1